MAENGNAVLQRPLVRCLTKDEAADYLGIGVTLFTELHVPSVKFGRWCVYDVVDLDAWLDEYKRRGRAGKDAIWPVKPESTGERDHVSGGSMLSYRTANEYEKALRLNTETRRKLSSQS